MRLLLSAAAALLSIALVHGEGTPPSNGYVDNGYYYHWSTDGQSTAYLTNPPRSYTLTWDGPGALFGGKGWNPGTSTRVINYAGIYSPNGNSSLAVYGWTRNPRVEYHIVEAYSADPSVGAIELARIVCNNAEYRVLWAKRVNEPSIDGVATFDQLWSVREPPKSVGNVNGTVDMACHWRSWKDAGQSTGTHSYQIVAARSWGGKGSAIIYISQL